jgi:hypothetical protein
MSLLKEEVRFVSFLCVYLIILLLAIDSSESCLFPFMVILGLF